MFITCAQRADAADMVYVHTTPLPQAASADTLQATALAAASNDTETQAAQVLLFRVGAVAGDQLPVTASSQAGPPELAPAPPAAVARQAVPGSPGAVSPAPAPGKSRFGG